MLNKTVSRATVYRWVARITKNGISSKTSPGRPRTSEQSLLFPKSKETYAKTKRESQPEKFREKKDAHKRPCCLQSEMT